LPIPFGKPWPVGAAKNEGGAKKLENSSRTREQNRTRGAGAIQRPQTRSAAAHPLSNAHERVLAMKSNVYSRPFLGQTYLLEIFFFDPVREQPAAMGEFFVELRSIHVTPVSLACPFSSNVSFVTKVTKDTLDEKGQARDTGERVTLGCFLTRQRILSSSLAEISSCSRTGSKKKTFQKVRLT